ncbi:clathrin adaptor complex small chain-domain-containing protein, partial [Melampsora americana]
SLFFVTGIGDADNELITLKIGHHYMEALDLYFVNLDLIFNFQRVYAILNRLIIVGELQKSSKKSVLRAIGQSDSIKEGEANEGGSLARIASGR